MRTQLRHPLLEHPIKDLLVYEHTDHVRVVVERQHALQQHGEQPKGVLFVLHDPQQAAHEEVHALAVADCGVSLCVRA